MSGQQFGNVPPGSDAAVQSGCTCPVLDNARGAGWLGSGTYWISPSCSLHAGVDDER